MIKKRSFFTFTSCLVLVSFLFSFVFHEPLIAVTSLLQQRAAGRDLAGVPEDHFLPYSYGHCTGGAYVDNEKLVVYVQDLHCHPQVQKNIYEILKLFNGRYNVRRVLVEGAPAGKVDTSILVSIGDEKVRKKTLSILLDRGLIGGAEYFSIVENQDKLYGLERWEVYRQNRERLRHLLGQKEHNSAVAKALEQRFNGLKQRYLTGGLKKLEKRIEPLDAGKKSSSKRYVFLEKVGERTGRDVRNYPNLWQYIRMMKLNRDLRFDRLPEELSQYMAELKRVLPYREYQALLEKTNGKQEEYYLALARSGESFLPQSIKRYPELGKFFDYIRLNYTLNPMWLVGEEKAFCASVLDNSAETLMDHELLFLARMSMILNDLVEVKVTPDDFDYYQKNLAVFRALLQKYLPKGAVGEALALINNDELCDFYKTNLSRNGIFMQNCPQDTGAVPSDGVMASTGGYRSVLAHMDSFREMEIVVTGGFHSAMAKGFRDRNVSYLVITPNVTDEYRDTVYEKVITGRITPQDVSTAAFVPALISAGLSEQEAAETVNNLQLLIAANIEAGKANGVSSEEICKMLKEWLVTVRGRHPAFSERIGDRLKIDLVAGRLVLETKYDADGRQIAGRWYYDTGRNRFVEDASDGNRPAAGKDGGISRLIMILGLTSAGIAGWTGIASASAGITAVSAVYDPVMSLAAVAAAAASAVLGKKLPDGTFVQALKRFYRSAVKNLVIGITMVLAFVSPAHGTGHDEGSPVKGDINASYTLVEDSNYDLELKLGGFQSAATEAANTFGSLMFNAGNNGEKNAWTARANLSHAYLGIADSAEGSGTDETFASAYGSLLRKVSLADGLQLYLGGAASGMYAHIYDNSGNSRYGWRASAGTALRFALPGVRFLAGAVEGAVMVPEAIQAPGRSWQVDERLFFAKMNAGDLPGVRISLDDGPAERTVMLQLDKDIDLWGRPLLVTFGGSTVKPHEPVFVGKKVISGSLQYDFPRPGMTVELGGSLERLKDRGPDDKKNNGTISMRITFPFGPLARGRDATVTAGATASNGRDFPRLQEYITTQSDFFENYDFSAGVKDAVKNAPDYQGFLAYAKENTPDEKHLLWLAAAVGNEMGFTGYVHEDEGRTTRVTTEDEFVALQRSFSGQAPLGVDAFTAIHGFLADVINARGMEGVKAYTMDTGRKGNGHVITVVHTPEQICIIDYGRIIKTGTKDIEKALRGYQRETGYQLPLSRIYRGRDSFVDILAQPYVERLTAPGTLSSSRELSRDMERVSDDDAQAASTKSSSKKKKKTLIAVPSAIEPGAASERTGFVRQLISRMTTGVKAFGALIRTSLPLILAGAIVGGIFGGTGTAFAATGPMMIDGSIPLVHWPSNLVCLYAFALAFFLGPQDSRFYMRLNLLQASLRLLKKAAGAVIARFSRYGGVKNAVYALVQKYMKRWDDRKFSADDKVALLVAEDPRVVEMKTVERILHGIRPVGITLMDEDAEIHGNFFNEQFSNRLQVTAKDGEGNDVPLLVELYYRMFVGDECRGMVIYGRRADDGQQAAVSNEALLVALTKAIIDEKNQATEEGQKNLFERTFDLVGCGGNVWCVESDDVMTPALGLMIDGFERRSDRAIVCRSWDSGIFGKGYLYRLEREFERNARTVVVVMKMDDGRRSREDRTRPSLLFDTAAIASLAKIVGMSSENGTKARVGTRTTFDGNLPEPLCTGPMTRIDEYLTRHPDSPYKTRLKELQRYIGYFLANPAAGDPQQRAQMNDALYTAMGVMEFGDETASRGKVAARIRELIDKDITLLQKNGGEFIDMLPPVTSPDDPRAVERIVMALAAASGVYLDISMMDEHRVEGFLAGVHEALQDAIAGGRLKKDRLLVMVKGTEAMRVAINKYRPWGFEAYIDTERVMSADEVKRLNETQIIDRMLRLRDQEMNPFINAARYDEDMPKMINAISAIEGENIAIRMDNATFVDIERGFDVFRILDWLAATLRGDSTPRGRMNEGAAMGRTIYNESPRNLERLMSSVEYDGKRGPAVWLALGLLKGALSRRGQPAEQETTLRNMREAVAVIRSSGDRDMADTLEHIVNDAGPASGRLGMMAGVLTGYLGAALLAQSGIDIPAEKANVRAALENYLVELSRYVIYDNGRYRFDPALGAEQTIRLLSAIIYLLPAQQREAAVRNLLAGIKEDGWQLKLRLIEAVQMSNDVELWQAFKKDFARMEQEGAARAGISSPVHGVAMPGAAERLNSRVFNGQSSFLFMGEGRRPDEIAQAVSDIIEHLLIDRLKDFGSLKRAVGIGSVEAMKAIHAAG